MRCQSVPVQAGAAPSRPRYSLRDVLRGSGLNIRFTFTLASVVPLLYGVVMRTFILVLVLLSGCTAAEQAEFNDFAADLHGATSSWRPVYQQPVYVYPVQQPVHCSTTFWAGITHTNCY